LGLALAGFRPEFSTQNTLTVPERVEMQLDSGPFKQLSGQWRFEPMGSGTQVSLDLHFEVARGLLSRALSTSFGRVADRMVDDFCQRAIEVYGDEG
jgi:ribosome-associated toxin RatA of RatAB toxin-antitoxin module